MVGGKGQAEVNGLEVSNDLDLVEEGGKARVTATPREEGEQLAICQSMVRDWWTMQRAQAARKAMAPAYLSSGWPCKCRNFARSGGRDCRRRRCGRVGVGRLCSSSSGGRKAGRRF